jgi:mRNA interferase MazF
VTQGDVYWCIFEQPDKKRPVVILTRTPAISFLNGISIAPLTRTMRDTPSFVFLDKDDGVPTECCVNLDAIQTLDKSRFVDYITTLPRDRMIEVRQAIEFAFGFEVLEEV